MNYLQKLLAGNAVEWKTLGEVADYEQPTKYLVESNNYNDNFLTPVLTAGKTFILGYTDETNGIYKASKKPVIIFDDFTTANKWVDFDFKAKSSAMKMITSKDESKFLLKYIYYWLNTLPSGLIEGDHKRQWISNYSNIKIPIPPLAVQAEIVRILDTFTELTAEIKAELTAELTLRKKQYAYYREQLLTFDTTKGTKNTKNVEWKTLGEVAEITIGEFVHQNRQDDLAEFPVYNGGITPTGYYKEFNNTGDKIIVSARGANAGYINRTSKPYWAGNSCYSIGIKDKSRLNWIYVYYYLKNNEMTLIGNQQKGSIPAVSKSQMEKLQIPIPPLAEQERIVGILDKFEALTSSISEGLPKEIALRQQQYEYYRDMLLNF